MTDRANGDELRDLRRRLLFETAPTRFSGAMASFRADLEHEFASASPERQAELIDLLAELSIDIASYLSRWHLLSAGHDATIDEAVTTAEVERDRELLRRWGAERRLGEMDAEIASIGRSNMRRITELTASGVVNNPIGHDAATGLTWAMRRGAIMVTTNPVMVNTVRAQDPATWDPVRDALRAEHPDDTPEQRASLMTMNVVLDECRELRPIWDATDGRFGYVSLQISPRAKDDPGRMAEEVQDLYARLAAELGGTPNTRFKIPGTRAGLDAVRRLTSAGIGVTVTVNASIDQQLAFGEVIEQGSAPLSFLVLMMGRLDDPVRDELADTGLADAVEVSRWASVAVLRRAYPIMYAERGFERSAIMAASMRGPWTIDGSLVDGPSPVFITVFPDNARDYDSVERSIASHVSEPLPAGVEEKLMRSPTFRQAYGVGVLPVDEFDSFKPVVQTLEQFSRNYDEFVDYNR